MTARLLEIGAKKVFDDVRTITTFDTAGRTLSKQDKLVRITEEDGVKITMHINNSNPKKKSEIKFKALLNKLGLVQNKTVVMGTEALHKLYNVDYFKEYAVRK